MGVVASISIYHSFFQFFFILEPYIHNVSFIFLKDRSSQWFKGSRFALGPSCPSLNWRCFYLERHLGAVPAQWDWDGGARALCSWEWDVRDGSGLHMGSLAITGQLIFCPPSGQARCEDKNSGFQTRVSTPGDSKNPRQWLFPFSQADRASAQGFG